MSEREDEICELAAHIHAATARLVQMAADLDTSGSWQGTGIRSAAHWLALHTGVAVYTGAEMVRVGHALEGLPLVRAAFSAGRLSFDKVRAATTIATAEDEAIWLDVALSATSAQLGRICKGFIRATGSDAAEKRQEQQRQREVKSWWREDGMLELVATLPPEEGQLVRAAIENAACLRDTRGAGEAPSVAGAGSADPEATPRSSTPTALPSTRTGPGAPTPSSGSASSGWPRPAPGPTPRRGVSSWSTSTPRP